MGTGSSSKEIGAGGSRKRRAGGAMTARYGADSENEGFASAFLSCARLAVLRAAMLAGPASVASAGMSASERQRSARPAPSSSLWEQKVMVRLFNPRAMDCSDSAHCVSAAGGISLGIVQRKMDSLSRCCRQLPRNLAGGKKEDPALGGRGRSQGREMPNMTANSPEQGYQAAPAAAAAPGLVRLDLASSTEEKKAQERVSSKPLHSA